MTQNNYASAIKKIAWGNLMILADISIGINYNNVDFLPAWMGYLLIYHAICTIGNISRQTNLLKPLAILLGVYEAILWTGDLLALSFSLPVISMIKEVVKMYFMFQLLTDIRDIAQSHGSRYTNALQTTRTIITVLNSFGYIARYIAVWWAQNAVTLIMTVIYGITMAVTVIYQAVLLFRYAKEEAGYIPSEETT